MTKMSKTKWILSIVGVLIVLVFLTDGVRSCSLQRDSKRFDKALAEGELTKAGKLLEDMRESYTRKRCGDLLVVEYLRVGEFDKAKSLWDRDIAKGDESGKALSQYLINAGRVDDAWEYYGSSSSSHDSYYYAEERYAYMVDVITYYCQRGEKDKAYVFVRKGVLWFNKYVDNAKDIKDNDRYAEYYSEPVRARLTSIIDQF